MSTILSQEEQQIVEAGIQARYLLENETFQGAINALSEQLSTAIINTGLEDDKRRERLYLMHTCLVELVNTLKQRVAAKENIEQRENADDNETEV